MNFYKIKASIPAPKENIINKFTATIEAWSMTEALEKFIQTIHIPEELIIIDKIAVQS